MRGNLTKTEKILIICTAVFLTVLCAVCFGEMAAGKNGSWRVETAYSAAPDQVVPPEAGRININTASEKLLTELPGIGAALAARIVEYRTVNGPFRTTTELLRVEGIGVITYLELMDQIIVEDNGK